jgi:hypothetical protein
MNMRQQRITTSQQEVYLIYLMEHELFAAAKIRDGMCVLLYITFFSLFFFIHTHFFRLSCFRAPRDI